jgi:hypothetical protein
MIETIGAIIAIIILTYVFMLWLGSDKRPPVVPPPRSNVQFGGLPPVGRPYPPSARSERLGDPPPRRPTDAELVSMPKDEFDRHTERTRGPWRKSDGTIGYGDTYGEQTLNRRPLPEDGSLSHTVNGG